MLIETQPESACIPNGDGDLPIHLIFSRRNEIIEDGEEPPFRSNSIRKRRGRRRT